MKRTGNRPFLYVILNVVKNLVWYSGGFFVVLLLRMTGNNGEKKPSSDEEGVLRSKTEGEKIKNSPSVCCADSSLDRRS